MCVSCGFDLCQVCLICLCFLIMFYYIDYRLLTGHHINIQIGHGVMQYASGDVYEGQWVSSQFHGMGKYTKSDGEVTEGKYYIGTFVNKPGKGFRKLLM